MAAYWQDVTLLFQRIHGSKPVVVHVEPDLWGYLEQAGDVSLASAFAQKWIALRDKLAPNVILAYHMSGWGTKHDIVYEKPPDATVRAYAAQSAAFYNSLHAHFDIAFEDFSDRDAGFYAKQEGQPEDVVHACGLPPAPALRADVRPARARAHGRVADPARKHPDARR